MMRSGAEMKTLAVVGVLLFMVGVSDSVVLNKCGLKQELEASGITLPQGVLNQTTADLLAKIVCHVNLTTGFNTSEIKQIANPNNCSNSQSSNKAARRARSVRIGKRPKSGKVEPSSVEEILESAENICEDGKTTWTLYGLFQFSDTVACSTTRTRSRNLCRMSCSKLTDSDIKDDLACVKVMINELIALIYQKECVDVVASSYFADC